MSKAGEDRPVTTSQPALDVSAIRAHFPALRAAPDHFPAAHFDCPGGTQTPDVVASAMYDVLTRPLANRGSVTLAERNAEAAVAGARQAMADLLGADPGGIIFGRSMTQLTFDLARTMAKAWGPGDEVIVSRLDHDSNIRPWVIAAESVGATVRWADFDTNTGELAPAAVGALLTERTKLVAVTAASNLIGTMPDIAAISALVHAANAWLYVDGVHYTAHTFVDVAALGADFYGCSPYKFLGPHCGVVAGRPELLEQLRPDKLLPATDGVPERFELGTLPYELMAGTTAAVNFLAGLVPSSVQSPDKSRRDQLRVSLAAVEHHEDRLRQRIEAALIEMPGVRIYSQATRRTPTLLVTFAGPDGSSLLDSRAIQRHLAGDGVNAPAGSFYALEASRCLGLGDDGGLRIGLAPYNDDEDVDRLITSLGSYFSAER